MRDVVRGLWSKMSAQAQPRVQLARSLVHRNWVRLHEPRVISGVYGVWWLTVTVLAGWSVFHPPRTIEEAAGDVLMSIISAVLTVGGLIGVVSVIRGVFWTERSAVAFVALGLFGYIVMVGYLWATGEGSRGLQLMGLIGAGVLTLIRLHWVMSKPYSRTSEIQVIGSGARADPDDKQ